VPISGLCVVGITRFRADFCQVNDSNDARMAMFVVDSTEAGEGCVDITVTGPNGTTVPHTVTSMGPTTVNVAFVPNQCGVHYACVAFNKENVPGNTLLLSCFTGIIHSIGSLLVVACTSRYLVR